MFAKPLAATLFLLRNLFQSLICLCELLPERNKMTLSSDDIHFMQLALDLALQAQHQDEVPVCAVVVQNGRVVGRGFNSSITTTDPTAHAEVMAMRNAGAHLANYRLLDCTLYVTLEPCAMCVGAIFHARIKRLVYAASDPKTGACGSVIDLPAEIRLNHHMQVTKGILASESSTLLKQFFVQRRKNAG